MQYLRRVSSAIGPVQSPDAIKMRRISTILRARGVHVPGPITRSDHFIASRGTQRGLIPPTQLFNNNRQTAPTTQSPPVSIGNTSNPDYKSAGHAISAVAQQYGYARGQKISDKNVIKAMMNKAGEIYGIPGSFLYRTAMRESGAKHWDKQGRIKSRAAVGIMQIEKSAYPDYVKGGASNALNNVYDLGNNIAMGAKNIRKNLDRLAKRSGYKGNNVWRDIGPLLNISYNAGAGALRKVMRIAREKGLNPFDWQHLAFGRNVTVPNGGRFNVPRDWIENAPLHQGLKEIHDSRAARGVHNYPIYWTGASNIRLHDFDQSGVTTRAEHLISRIVYTMTGKRIKAR